MAEAHAARLVPLMRARAPWAPESYAARFIVTTRKGRPRLMLLECERADHGDGREAWRWRVVLSDGYRFGMASSAPAAMAQAEAAAGLR